MNITSKAMIGASANLIILCILAQKDSYGYEIVRMTKILSDGRFRWGNASIYPTLKKLEKNAMVKSYWHLEGNNRARKYYSISDSGRAKINSSKEEWMIVHNLLTELWKPVK